MDWTKRIDAYCERLTEAFWAEPLNALTNIAFILAAIFALRLAAREGRVDGPVIALSANAFAVGIGSFLFHTFATRWAALADTGPIMIFILGYFAVAMNRFGGFGWGRSVLLMLGFLAAMIAMSAVLRYLVHDIIGGSQSYFPAFFAMLGVGLWLDRMRSHPAGVWLVRAALIFAVSLTFRTLDGPLCEIWPHGTHFAWHLLNGLLFWILLRTLVRHGRAPARRAVRVAA